MVYLVQTRIRRDKDFQRENIETKVAEVLLRKQACLSMHRRTYT